jgi:hypothetical protein
MTNQHQPAPRRHTTGWILGTLTAAALAVTIGITAANYTRNQPTDTEPAPTVAAVDPYEVYQGIAPAGAPNLSREDAQARALLGCETTWAPGTVDHALHQAYGPTICPK